MLRTDAELLEHWRNGDRVAGKELFERYFYQVERFFLNKVSQGVDDLVQETFLGCVNNRDRIADSGRFRSYLFSIAYNVLRSHLRTAYRRGEHIDFDAVAIADLTPGPSSIVAHIREHRLLLHGLRKIPVDYQVVLELHYWEQLTTDEIAAVQDTPVGTIRSRLRRARQLLETAMSELADNPDLLTSTLSNLDDWAAQCRTLLPTGTPTERRPDADRAIGRPGKPSDPAIE